MNVILGLIQQDNPCVDCISQFNVFWIYLVIMIASGILGGFINFYIEKGSALQQKWILGLDDSKNAKIYIKERNDLLKSNILTSIGATFLVPLFLHMVGNELINSKLSFSYQFILLFISYSILASMAARRFINNITDRVLKMTKEATDKAERIEGEVHQQKVQEELDSENVQVILDWLEDTREEEELSTTEMAKKLEELSKSAKRTIAQKAREFRQNNWVDHPSRLKKLVPLYTTLIDLKADNMRRLNGQLGYVYKDMENPNYDLSIDHLTTAISLREKAGSNQTYEFNRAMAYILKEKENVSKNQPSTPEIKNKIVDDLIFASKNDFWKGLITNIEKGVNLQPLHDWAKLNQFKIPSV